MAMSQSFRRDFQVLEHASFSLMGKWAIGSTGAVGTKTGGKGMSLTRNSTGNYTIQLLGSKGVSARCNAILHCAVSIFVNDTDPTNDTDGHYVKMLAISDSAGTVTFQAQDEAGVVREIPSGGVVTVHLDGRLSSAA